MAIEDNWEIIMRVEDSLQVADIFYSPTGRRNCHSDSYGTCVDYTTLEKWSNSHTFQRPQIQDCITYWETNPNVGPPLRIIAAYLSRKLRETENASTE